MLPFPNEERDFQLPDSFTATSLKTEPHSDTDATADDVSTPRERERDRERQRNESTSTVRMIVLAQKRVARLSSDATTSWVCFHKNCTVAPSPSSTQHRHNPSSADVVTRLFPPHFCAVSSFSVFRRLCVALHADLASIHSLLFSSSLAEKVR